MFVVFRFECDSEKIQCFCSQVLDELAVIVIQLQVHYRTMVPPAFMRVKDYSAKRDRKLLFITYGICLRGFAQFNGMSIPSSCLC